MEVLGLEGGETEAEVRPGKKRGEPMGSTGERCDIWGLAIGQPPLGGPV